jgi:CheY-like chemotaxis protein
VNESKTIVYIEDQPIFSKIMLRVLEQYSAYTVIHAPDGTHILHMMRQYKPDLLILDYELPGLNGIEIYDLVHATEGLEHIPALMVSAELPRREIAKRGIAGLMKPCRTEEFMQAVQTALMQAVPC